MELNNESKTLFIPLYGKAMMSKNNLFINDPKAEEIISKVKFNFEDLKQSKWLSMYMALRAKIIDEICNRYITQNPNTTVIHLGCGLDSRCLRVDNNNISWYDIDFQSVIDLRKQFYKETEKYKMIGKSVTDLSWLDEIDLDNKKFSIIGKGNKERTGYLNDMTKEALIDYLKVRDTLISKKSNNTLFLSRYGTKMSSTAIEKIVKRAYKRAKIKYDNFCVHTLRHTCATLLYRNGIDIRTIQELLGHVQIDTTEIYTHLYDKNVMDVMLGHPLGKFMMADAKALCA